MRLAVTECEVARLTIDVSFQGKITVKLIESQTGNNEQSYVVDCNSDLYCSENQHQRLTAGGAYIEQLLCELEAANVPVLPDKAMGCDGTSYELTLTRESSAVTYRWWCEAPKGYEPVVKFTNELLRLARCGERASMF